MLKVEIQTKHQQPLNKKKLFYNATHLKENVFGITLMLYTINESHLLDSKHNSKIYELPAFYRSNTTQIKLVSVRHF